MKNLIFMLFIAAMLLSCSNSSSDNNDPPDNNTSSETCGDCYTTQGACSSHGGVNCSVGADSDGSVICNDGWKGSSVDYNCN